MIRLAFEVLVERGYSAEGAYFECLHELKLIVDLIQRYGIAGMYRGVSETARYGGLVIGPSIMTEETKDRMRKALDKVQSGEFAKEWVSAYEREGANSFEKYLQELENHPIEQMGKKLRAMMWPEDTKAGKVASWSKLQKKALLVTSSKTKRNGGSSSTKRRRTRR